ncbi:VWA domain-containing protein [Methanobrevibacter curvatus]|uniref:VWA domain containing CoxE-like protein n=1 Tax=Methanobrevibacter curvatus TaxID=49547 RepID=A0A166CBJ4_9EURY|nr:VWA domain-containing protein [Methanobrevibacter curvatus]KZX14338.1 VWA domain containing CoxE-like protein [Methanobrevibacter curvatus]
MMEEIVKFSGKLRENGIPSSIRSTQLAYEANVLLEKNGGNLKEGLAAIYLKDQRHRKKFDKAYEDFFLNEDKEEEKAVLHENGIKSPFMKTYNVSVSSKRVSRYDPGKDSQKYKISYIQNSLNEINNEANKEGNSELLRNDIKTINTLQVELIDLCQKLGQKIATKRSRQNKIAKKQKPDIRRSIRKNMKHGGTLLELMKSKPKIKKQNHYFLSDISVSCDWISIWFFCMVYIAQNSFNRAKVYEFDNKIAEITPALYEPDLIDAFIKVMKIRHSNSMIRGKSNMFTAFEEFEKHANLNRKSYLLILSDCRDWAGPKENRIPKSAELIENMVKKSKRAIILNPEEKKKWNVADSCVSHYENVGAEIFEVRNLEQLANLIIEI